MIYAPIWKDTYYSTTAESLTYTIKDASGETLYSGKAVKLPDADVLEININQICRNYMNNDLPDFRGVTGSTSYTNSNACKVFRLYRESELLESYTFLWDWSYSDWNGGSKSMSYPVNGHKDVRMMDFSTTVSSNVVTNSIAHNTTGHCGDWALYYQCKFGGWCSYLVEGNSMRTDTVTQYKYSKAVRNTSNDFEETIYTDDIERRWQLHTGWLSDQEASNIAENLLQSTRIFAHDLVHDVIFPVVITDTSIDHKTYRNQGHKPFNYTINIKASHQNIRR
mgnify:CR=1 FL=1